MALDASAACAGFLYCLTLANHLIQSGSFRHVLVVGAETLSRIINYKDRESCILFGDGAGAVILSRDEDGQSKIIYSHVQCDGSGFENLYVPAGGSRRPIKMENVEFPERYVKMRGREVFKHATRTMIEGCTRALQASGVSTSAIDHAIIHQANKRIIEAVTERLSIPSSKVLYNVEDLGSTSSASIPILFDQCVRDGKIHRGDLILMSAFGAGFTSGTSVMSY